MRMVEGGLMRMRMGVPVAYAVRMVEELCEFCGVYSVAEFFSILMCDGASVSIVLRMDCIACLFAGSRSLSFIFHGFCFCFGCSWFILFFLLRVCSLCGI